MNYLITDAYRNLIAKATTLHTARVIACALSNEEENAGEFIYIVFRTPSNELLVKGFYADGKLHIARTRLIY